MNIEESDIAAAIRAGAGHIGHVLFVDSKPPTGRVRAPRFSPDRRGARRDRLRPLCLGRGAAYPDPDGAARRTMLAYRRLFRADAAFPNVSCKLSGMITEADWRPLIEALGPLAESERELIFGGTAARFYGLTA